MTEVFPPGVAGKAAPPSMVEPPALSTRVRVAPPATIDALVARHCPAGSSVINLCPGGPHHRPPLAYLPPTAALDALSGYGAVAGEAHLRSLLAARAEVRPGTEVTVTAGANAAFWCVLAAIADPGDAIALYTPYYSSHAVSVGLAGCVLQTIPAGSGALGGDADWVPTVAALDAHLTERSAQMAAAVEADAPPPPRLAAVVVTSPGNPTGAVVPDAELRAMAAAAARAGAWLVIDAAYEAFVFDGTPRAAPLAAPNVVTIHTLSKTYGLAGWRVGYAIHPAALTAALATVQDAEATHACRPAQALAAGLLSALPDSYVAERVAEVAAARDALWRAARLGDLVPAVGRPAGGFFFLVPLPKDWASAEDVAVAVMADEAAVLVTPGREYGAPGTVRVAFAAVAEVGGGVNRATEAGMRLRRGLDLLRRRRPPPTSDSGGEMGGL
ncbi:hypothetical protein MMPV_001113 [Pyropia vietnamensis]